MLSVAAGGVASAADSDETNRTTRSLVEAVNEARLAAEIEPVEADPVLSRAARDHATEIAARPHAERMSVGASVEALLERQGAAGHYRRTWKRTDLSRNDGVAAVTAALSRWRESASAWRAAEDPDLTRLGAATAGAADGWTVVVIAMAQPLERSPQTLGTWERRIARRINAIRSERGLLPLLWSEELAAVAREHSRAMAEQGFVDHVDPQGRRPADRLRAAGIDFVRAAENVASNRGTENPVRTAVNGWMRSGGHRGQILDPGFVETGVGIALADDGTYTFTQLFTE